MLAIFLFFFNNNTCHKTTLDLYFNKNDNRRTKMDYSALLIQIKALKAENAQLKRIITTNKNRSIEKYSVCATDLDGILDDRKFVSKATAAKWLEIPKSTFDNRFKKGVPMFGFIFEKCNKVKECKICGEVKDTRAFTIKQPGRYKNYCKQCGEK